MPSAKSVVLALRALEKSGEPIFLAQRFEPVGPAGEKLVRVALVSHIPHEPILRSVEDRMQRDRQLDDPQSSPYMATGSGADLDQTYPHLF